MNFENSIDRRRFVQGAGLALAATSPLLLAACGDDADSSSDVDEANDLKVVLAGQAREWRLVATYSHILDAPNLIAPDAKPLVEQILNQENSHANGLGTVIHDLNGKPVAPKETSVYAKELGIDSVRDQQGAIAAAVRIESDAISAYIREIPKLTIGDLRATWTSLATSAAQHIAVLNGIAAPGDHRKQSPQPLVMETAP